MNCIACIQSRYASLSASDRRIADFFIKEPDTVVKLSIHEIAAAIGCAPSSITKFVHKIGYDSFAALRIDLVRSIDMESASNFNSIIDSSTDQSAAEIGFFKSINEVFAATLKITDFQKIGEAVNLLTRAKNCFLFGVGSSSLIAQDFQQKLIKLKKPTIFQIDGNYGIQNSQLATENDVAIAVSYSGRTDEVVRAARIVKDNGCPLIAMTRDSDSPLSRYADINLYVPNCEPVTRVASIYSRYAFMFLVDLLFLTAIQKEDSASQKILEGYHELWK